MSSDTIKELLDILALNLTFHEDTFQKERINGELYFVFENTLTYRPEKCSHSHQENNQTLIKWGWKKVSILLNDISNYKTILRINKQRYKCKHCGKIFLTEDSVSDCHCFIVCRVKQAVLERLSEPHSMSLIAPDETRFSDNYPTHTSKPSA